MRVLNAERQQKIKELLLEGKEIGEVAKILDCDRKTIYRWKKKFSIGEVERPFLLKLENLIKDFDQGHYDELGRQFDDDEIVTYIETYSTYRKQFDDLFGTEKTQIHHVISQQILINRTMRRLKQNEGLLQDIIDEIKCMGKLIKKEKDPEQLQRYTEERHVLRSNLPEVSGTLDKLNKQVKELEGSHRQGLEKLSATRKERLEKSVNIRSDWKELIKGLEDRQNREIQGKLAERLRMAEEIESKRLRDPVEFADNSFDSILLDDKTEFEEE